MSLKQSELNPILHVTKQNTKIKDTLLFSIPPIQTCPKKTEGCAAKCYALKFWRVSPNCRQAWIENFQLSLQPNFVELMVEKINEIQSRSRKKYSYFRMNDSGDFYNQEYLDKWFEVARAFPDIKFLAYTKSYHLDYSNKPNNFMIRYSVWHDTKAVRTDMPLALMDGCDERGKTYHCVTGSKCGPCRVCWNTEIDVKFSLH